jgi:hypothetical protein
MDIAYSVIPSMAMHGFANTVAFIETAFITASFRQ